MNNETIKKKVGEILLSTLGEIQGDEEIREENDGDAQLKVTRHRLPHPVSLKIISFSVF